MPNLPSAAAICIGLGAALALGVATLLLQTASVQALVYTTYGSLMAPGVERFEVAWLLATIDWLLNLSVIWSLLLWVCFVLVAALGLRQPTGVFKAVSTGVLSPAGTWLLFAYKYAAIGVFGPIFPYFLLWRLLMTLCFAWLVGGLLVLPFWLHGRKAAKTVEAPRAVRFVCQRCGAEYASSPVVCIRCGAESTVRRVDPV